MLQEELAKLRLVGENIPNAQIVYYRYHTPLCKDVLGAVRLAEMR